MFGASTASESGTMKVCAKGDDCSEVYQPSSCSFYVCECYACVNDM